MNILQRKNSNALPSGKPWSLGEPLLSLTGRRGDEWTVGDSLESVGVFGATGSGKSSASGRVLASVFLADNYGGIVLCAKPQEAKDWERYCLEAGRSRSVIRFCASCRYRINFLEYVMGQSKTDGGLIDNVTNVLFHVIEASHARASGMGGGEQGADFWRKSLRQLLSMSIGALYHAYGRIRLDELIQLVNTAPLSEEQARDEHYQTWSFCYATVRKLFFDPAVPLPQREAANIASYFGQAFGRLDPKTRSNIAMTLMAEIDPFLREPLHTLFCTDTNITPEATHEGAVILLDLPIKRFEHVGTTAQILFKYLWQKATERRQVHAFTRPVFLFADEAQLFISSYDMEFLSTARSSRASTVYLTQNLPSLYASMGGSHPQDRVDALLGNFQTKIFHANTCARTNQWAAEMIGKAVWRRASGNWSSSVSDQASESLSGNWSRQDGENRGYNWGSSGGFSYSDPGGPVSMSYSSNAGRQNGTSTSRSRGGGWSRGTSWGTSDSEGGGWSEQMDYRIQPADFANRLRQGGPRNDFEVTAILVQANRRFSRTGSCWMPVSMLQR